MHACNFLQAVKYHYIRLNLARENYKSKNLLMGKFTVRQSLGSHENRICLAFMHIHTVFFIRNTFGNFNKQSPLVSTKLPKACDACGLFWVHGRQLCCRQCTQDSPRALTYNKQFCNRFLWNILSVIGFRNRWSYQSSEVALHNSKLWRWYFRVLQF